MLPRSGLRAARSQPRHALSPARGTIVALTMRCYSTNTKTNMHHPDSTARTSRKPKVQWFYAKDAAISRSQGQVTEEAIANFEAKKWTAFSRYDSSHIEHVFQTYASGNSEKNKELIEQSHKTYRRLVNYHETPLAEFYEERKKGLARRKEYNHEHDTPVIPLDVVPVNEDNLFSANVSKLTVSSTYWDGPVYAIRRGLWFDTDNNPLPSDLSMSIEEGFQKLKPWEFQRNKDGSLDKQRDKSNATAVDEDSELAPSSLGSLERDMSSWEKLNRLSSKENDYWTIELRNKKSGKMEKKSVFFADSYNAYIVDDLRSLNKVKLFLLQKLPKGSGLVPGFTYIKRGYTKGTDENDDSKSTIEKKSKTKKKITPEEKEKGEPKQANGSFPFSAIAGLLTSELGKILPIEASDSQTSELIRQQMDSGSQEPHKDGTSNHREVDHLVFCIHGIGQILGAKVENLSFIHTVNLLRKNLKQNAKDFLGSEKNCKVQVVPIVWRNLIDFNNKNHTLSQKNRETARGNPLPSLQNITIKEIEPVRYLINNTLLDILLYYETRYKNEILLKVIEEINRTFRKFLLYNPNFKGKVSLVGHSLGSAIGYDILSLQKFNLSFPNIEKSSTTKEEANEILNSKLLSSSDFFGEFSFTDCQLDFNVDNYFAIGSPFGLFNLLKKKRIQSRKLLSFYPDTASLEQLNMADFSFPSCNRFYNVFDTCDPVAYRVEPLVNKALSDKKMKEIKYGKLLKQNPSFIDTISDEIFSTGKSYFENYTESGLSMINKQVEGILGKPVFGENEKGSIARDQDEEEKEEKEKEQQEKEQVVRQEKIVAEKREKEKIERIEVSRQELKKSGSGEGTADSTKESQGDPQALLSSKNSASSKNGESEALGKSPQPSPIDALDTVHESYNERFHHLSGSPADIRQQIDLLSCNSTGHIDYCIPQNVYDLLIINTIKSHVTYFENQHVSKFILNEVLFADKVEDDGLVDDENKRIVAVWEEKENKK